MTKQKGVGLAEIMIAIFLSTLIITALMNQYVSMKQHYVQLQSSMEDAMELQLTKDFIQESIRQAGFTPCLGVDYLMTLDNRNGQTALSGINLNDELTIHRMSPYFNDLLRSLSSTRILVTQQSIIRDDRPILISDCYHAEVQRVMNVSHSVEGQTMTLASPLAFTYQPPVYVGEWLEERFFIQQGSGLFYQRGSTSELTPLVKTMAIKKSGNLVFMSLGLSGQQRLTFETRVRA